MVETIITENSLVMPRYGEGSAASQRLVAIQGMRGLAAMLVILDHILCHFCDGQIVPKSIEPLAWGLGTIGVEIFFVISGFLMTESCYRPLARRQSPQDFLVRRLIRIWPLYAIATVLEFLHKHAEAPIFTAGNLLKSLLFIPYIGESGEFRPILGQGWTLNYEMFFYLIFGLSLFLPRILGVMLIAVLLIGFSLVDLLGQAPAGIAGFYLNAVLLYFIAGMVVSWLKQGLDRGGYLPETGRLALALAGLAVGLAILAQALLSPAFALIPVLCFVGLSVLVLTGGQTMFTRRADTVFLSAMGGASYSVYLFHGAVIGFFSRFLVPSALTMGNIGVGLGALIASFVVGFGVFRLVEAPLLAGLNGAWRRFTPKKGPAYTGPGRNSGPIPQ